MDFSTREVRDLVVAWGALGLAFTFFILAPISPQLLAESSDLFVRVFVLSLATVGVGFLLHELAHKVVAIRFGQVASFRADYGMLAIAVLGGLVGFLFAAPGAVYHSGRVTNRENGLIAVAGPLTNVVLVGGFLPLFFLGGADGFIHDVGRFGATINAALAAFNMIPFGPLDGRKVLNWSVFVFGTVFLGCLGLGAAAYLYVWMPG